MRQCETLSTFITSCEKHWSEVLQWIIFFSLKNLQHSSQHVCFPLSLSISRSLFLRVSLSLSLSACVWVGVGVTSLEWFVTKLGLVLGHILTICNQSSCFRKILWRMEDMDQRLNSVELNMQILRSKCSTPCDSKRLPGHHWAPLQHSSQMLTATNVKSLWNGMVWGTSRGTH